MTARSDGGCGGYLGSTRDPTDLSGFFNGVNMPRSRSIKPGIMCNEDVAECDFATRLLFIYLWMLADREGRLEDRPRRIRVQSFPYDHDLDIDSMLSSLHEKRLILRYQVDGNKYIQILNFKKHQTPHVKERGSTIPAPEKEVSSTSVAPPDSLTTDSLTTDSLNHESLTEDKKHTAHSAARNGPRAKSDPPEEFLLAWSKYPTRVGGNPRKRALNAWNARVREGYSPNEMLDGLERYRRFCEATGIVGTSYVMQAATFFGPDRRWEEDWGPPQDVNPMDAKAKAVIAAAMGAGPAGGVDTSTTQDTAHRTFDGEILK